MLAIAAGAGLLDHAWTAAAAPWPFIVALCAFGMPHGAADWTVSARLSGRSGAWSRLAGFAGYLAMMLASLAVIMWQPGVAALLFLLLTVFHFGMADATAVLADDDGPVARWGLVLGRGLLLLSTAFAAHPQEAWEPFARIGAALSPSASPWQPGIAVLRDLAAVGVAAGAALAACSAVARIRAGHPREAALDLAEHALVATLAAAADPLFAVGCFFLGVHAFRHSRRLACTRCVIEAPHAQSSQGRPAAPRPGLLGRLLRVHVASLPLMWPTAACLAVLCWLIGGADARTLADASIAFYMITTLPHHLLGLRLPRPDMPPAARAA
jgi:Brp/Blh family beta-carotene 15,15'-monooxygenase